MKSLAVLSVLTLAGAVAQAGMVGNALTIVANSSKGVATYTVAPPTGSDWEVWSWNMPGRVDMLSSTGAVVASLENLGMLVFHDPVVSINFTAIAGAVPTNFTIYSGELVFPGLPGASGIASAGLTVTDRNGDGASLTGNYAGGKAHRAVTNGDVSVGGGITFANLVSGIAAGAFGTQIGSESFSSALIPGTTSSMSTGFDFTLSAGDSVGGTSVFQVVPAPGAAALMGLAGLTVVRRRR